MATDKNVNNDNSWKQSEIGPSYTDSKTGETVSSRNGNGRQGGSRPFTPLGGGIDWDWYSAKTDHYV